MGGYFWVEDVLLSFNKLRYTHLTILYANRFFSFYFIVSLHESIMQSVFSTFKKKDEGNKAKRQTEAAGYVHNYMSDIL